MKRPILIVIALITTIILAACGGDAVAGDPADTVEQYLQAKVDSDRDQISQLLCIEMEADLEREVQSLANVETRLQDMSCTSEEGSDIVSCTGNIVATYGTEDRELPLTSYRVVQEDGEWKWCGESE